MLMAMFLFNWGFSMMFIYMNHPLSLGCVLLIQTLLISMSSGFFYYNFWFGYILFLVMIGGMLVMFIYMTSVASNEKFKMPNTMTFFFTMMISSVLIMIEIGDGFFLNFVNLSASNTNQSNPLCNLTLNKFFNQPNMNMMIFMMFYLLVTLITTVKIIGKNFGTLRQK